MKIKRLNFNFLIIITFLFVSFLNCCECITSFHEDITVQKDGALLVTETIKAFVTGRNIKRGLYSDFLTIYWRNCLRSQVEFIPLKVLLDDHELPIDLQNIDRGKRVFKLMESQGHPYISIWYNGSKFHRNYFASIASAAPGSVSGFKGVGSFGGGSC